MAQMRDTELKALLDAEYSDALAANSSAKLSEERSDAMDYYLGDMSKSLPSADGRSTAVSMDVADTVEGMLPQLMEIFTGSDEVVKFNPVGPEDVGAAEQETDYVNHVFMNQNPGFLVLYSFVKDALLSKLGVVKVWWEEREEEERETYYDQPDDAFALITASPDVEVIEHTPKQGQDGMPLHDVTVVKKSTKARACVEAVPPEEFGIERNARSLRDCNYCFHKVTRTESQLIEQGYDEAQIKKLPSHTATTNSEELSRDSVDESQMEGDNINTAARKIQVVEHYVRMDYEQKGKACLYRVVTGGSSGASVILKRAGKPDIEQFDWMPFAAMTPVIITHRFFGRSIADLVKDIQKIKTALLRAALDNQYLANNPRVEVAEALAGPNTIDDLLVSRPGGIVRTKQPGGLQWQKVPSIAGEIFPILEYMDSIKETRTGVTKQGQGLDANALQNQSATAANQLFTVAQARIRLVARIFAETGVKDLFWLLHGLIRKHGQQAETVRLRNNWVQVDPRSWKNRADLTVSVGLGTGSKAEQIVQTQMLAQFQERAIAAGMVSPKNLWNTARRLTKLMGEKDPEAYFTDPTKQPDQQDPSSAPIKPPENPEIQKMQMQAQIEGQKMQLQAQQDEKSDQRKAQIEQVQAEADIATQERKMQAEMAKDAQKFQFDREMAIMQFQLDAELKRNEDARKEREHQQRMQQGEVSHFQKVTSADQAHQHKMEQSAAKSESAPA
jgi:hypothetical protein